MQNSLSVNAPLNATVLKEALQCVDENFNPDIFRVLNFVAQLGHQFTANLSPEELADPKMDNLNCLYSFVAMHHFQFMLSSIYEVAIHKAGAECWGGKSVDQRPRYLAMLLGMYRDGQYKAFCASSEYRDTPVKGMLYAALHLSDLHTSNVASLGLHVYYHYFEDLKKQIDFNISI